MGQASMPLLDRGQLRKRWRYVVVSAEELMLCAAHAEVGPLTQSFWILWDRERRRQWAHTALRPDSREGTLEGPPRAAPPRRGGAGGGAAAGDRRAGRAREPRAGRDRSDRDHLPQRQELRL